jgi:cell fate (sporulation/competence/biofilm development) regulator YmcA (YheA/YmcA/DUF963 family)
LKKYLLIIAIALLFSAMLAGDGLGIVAYLDLSKHHHDARRDSSGHTPVIAHPVSRDIIVKMRKFVITIPESPHGNYGQFYLQVAIAFETDNKRAVKDFEKLRPIIQSMVIGDVMESGSKLQENPIALKKLISSSALQAANQTITKTDSRIHAPPFFGAYVTSYINQ